MSDTLFMWGAYALCALTWSAAVVLAIVAALCVTRLCSASVGNGAGAPGLEIDP